MRSVPLFASIGCAIAADPGPYSPSWSSVVKHDSPPWFADAKFGIYAHFGVFSVPAYDTEWYSRNMYVQGSKAHEYHTATYGEEFGYKDFIPMFTASKFNATEWVELYRRAGARYAGPVAEHADGFCMWDTKYSDFNAVKMGPQRDIVGEMSAAVREAGLKLVTTLHHEWLWAWYPTFNSSTDCGDAAYQLTETQGGLYGQAVSGPDQFSKPSTTQLFQDYFRNKSLELIEKYQPDLVYFDSKLAATIDEVHRLDFLAGFYNQAYQWGHDVGVTYKSSDMEVGAGIIDHERGGCVDVQPVAWQTDDSMDRNSWSWVEPPSLKNATELLGQLVDVVSKNGSFLLNIPPHADGSIDPSVREILYAMGDWLAVNGEAIYGSRPFSSFGEGPTSIIPGFGHEWPMFTANDYRFTTQGGRTLYIVAMAWSDRGFLVKSLNSSASLAPLGTDISDVHLLGAAEPSAVTWSRTSNGLHLLPASRPAVDHAFVFRLDLTGAAAESVV